MFVRYGFNMTLSPPSPSPLFVATPLLAVFLDTPNNERKSSPSLWSVKSHKYENIDKAP